MKQKRQIRKIARTAVLLALLVALQALTAGWGQLVTGSCVNAILAVAALTVGWSGGLVIALASPVLAYFLGIAPQVLTVPAIMAGNAVYVLLLYFVADRESRVLWRQVTAWLAAALGKFAVMYGIVVGLICGVMAENLLNAGTLKQPMIAALTVKFGWMQLVTALIGGAAAMLLLPILRKATKNNG